MEIKKNASRIFRKHTEIICLLHIPSQEKSAPRGAVTVQLMLFFLFLNEKLIEFTLYFKWNAVRWFHGAKTLVVVDAFEYYKTNCFLCKTSDLLHQKVRQKTIKVNIPRRSWVEFFSGFNRSCWRHGIYFVEKRLRYQMFVILGEVSIGNPVSKKEAKIKTDFHRFN